MSTIKATENEKGRFDDTTLAQKPVAKLARLISEVSDPLFVALPTFGVLTLHTAPDVVHALLWWIVTTSGITAAPLILIVHGVHRRRYTNRHLPVREQRFFPLMFGLGCACLAFVLLLLLHASHALIATIVATLCSGAIAALITKYWKISFHLIGTAGAVTVFVLIFGPLAYILAPMIIVVGWARWQVRAHTLWQVLAGTALAIGVTGATFWLFGFRII